MAPAGRPPAGARRAESRPRAPAAAPAPVQSTSVDGGTLPSTPPSSTSSSPRSTSSGRTPRGSDRRPGAGGLARAVGRGRGQRLADGGDQPGDARVRRVTHGDAALAPAQLRRAASPRRQGAPASADRARTRPRAPAPTAVSTRPHSSAIARLETSSRNGLPGARPLSRASASSAGTDGSGAESVDGFGGIGEEAAASEMRRRRRESPPRSRRPMRNGSIMRPRPRGPPPARGPRGW